MEVYIAHLVPIDFLKDIINPFEIDPWGCGPISLEMVAAASPNNERWNPDDDDQLWTAEQHAGRIRYLAEQERIDPISIDVGVPVVGYYARRILDGHHRLCAAIVRGDALVPCDVQGQLDVLDFAQEDH